MIQGDIHTERDRNLFEREFKDWLPSKIVDAHVHVFDKSALEPGFEFSSKNCYQKFGGQHSIEQYEELTDEMLPGIECSLLSFGHPMLEANLEKSAAYTGKISDNKRRFGLALVSPESNVDDVERWIRDYNLLGYKPYLDFVRRKPVDEIEAVDMLSVEQLELANQLGLVIVFHIPRSGRLADPINQRQMVELCEKYPNIKFIWAHIGRAYFMRNVVGYLDGIAQCPNAYIDTAMVNHAGVLEYAFKHFPQERILFGSDAPIAWLRGKSVEVNDQYAYLMGEDYEIGSVIYDKNHVVEFTSFFYEQLRGVKQAARNAKWSDEQLHRFFYKNAHTLLTSIRA